MSEYDSDAMDKAMPIDNRRNSKKMKSRTLESTVLIFGEITSRFKPMRVSLIKKREHRTLKDPTKASNLAAAC